MNINNSKAHFAVASLLMQPVQLDLERLPGSDANRLVTRLTGKLSLETVYNFIQTLRPEPAAHLVLDMSGVSFLDSAGVGALVQLFVHRRNAGKSFALAGLTQQHNYFHAGVSGTVADSACGYAAYTLMPADSSVLTVEYKMNLLAPADGEELIARAKVLRSGKTLKICAADVFVRKNAAEVHCATMLATIMCLHGKPDRAQ
jgi:uncharacterized protein (TIGR00369 family)